MFSSSSSVHSVRFSHRALCCWVPAACWQARRCVVWSMARAARHARRPRHERPGARRGRRRRGHVWQCHGAEPDTAPQGEAAAHGHPPSRSADGHHGHGGRRSRRPPPWGTPPGHHPRARATAVRVGRLVHAPRRAGHTRQPHTGGRGSRRDHSARDLAGRGGGESGAARRPPPRDAPATGGRPPRRIAAAQAVCKWLGVIGHWRV